MERNFLDGFRGNFREQLNIEKGSAVFRDGMFQMKICVPFQAIIVTSFRPWRLFFKIGLICTNG